MNNEKVLLSQAAVQQTHRQEKQEALAKRQRKIAYAKLSKHICATVYDVFPELQESIDSNSGKIPYEVLEQIEDIKLILRYFSTHSRVLDSLRTGVLGVDV